MALPSENLLELGYQEAGGNIVQVRDLVDIEVAAPYFLTALRSPLVPQPASRYDKWLGGANLDSTEWQMTRWLYVEERQAVMIGPAKVRVYITWRRWQPSFNPAVGHPKYLSIGGGASVHQITTALDRSLDPIAITYTDSDSNELPPQGGEVSVFQPQPNNHLVFYEATWSPEDVVSKSVNHVNSDVIFGIAKGQGLVVNNEYEQVMAPYRYPNGSYQVPVYRFSLEIESLPVGETWNPQRVTYRDPETNKIPPDVTRPSPPNTTGNGITELEWYDEVDIKTMLDTATDSINSSTQA